MHGRIDRPFDRSLGRALQPSLDEIADAFNRRAPQYARGNWHRASAARLVELCALRPGMRVLDAGTGTGFAALAAAPLVGPNGRVVGVDVSPGMLRQADAARREARLDHVELLEANALDLPMIAEGSFDAVVCACGLLYMPASRALREWRRLLAPGGRLAFSLIESGSPPAARIFRECAARFGVQLRDPCATLGSVSACRQLLREAGYGIERVVREAVTFSAEDLALAWESNARSAAYAEVRQLSPEDREALQRVFLDTLAREDARDADALRRSVVIYALATR